jgi:hypothetical protein
VCVSPMSPGPHPQKYAKIRKVTFIWCLY